MNIVNMKIDEIREYENNPRKNEGAVDAVSESIRKFGFKVPIIVDKNNIIVAGHTRYKAAKLLRLETVPCIIADDLNETQIKAYRLVDNKVAEFSKWDYELLESELCEIDLAELDLTIFGIQTLSNPDFGEFFEDDGQEKEKAAKILCCPNCGHVFEN